MVRHLLQALLQSVPSRFYKIFCKSACVRIECVSAGANLGRERKKEQSKRTERRTRRSESAVSGREEVRTEGMFIWYRRNDDSWVFGLKDGEEPEEV